MQGTVQAKKFHGAGIIVIVDKYLKIRGAIVGEGMNLAFYALFRSSSFGSGDWY